MAYEPTNWQDGDIVTANKLNKMEQGITNGRNMIVGVSPETGALDKTWQEIYDAFASGTIVTILDVANGANNAIMVWVCVVAQMDDSSYDVIGITVLDIQPTAMIFITDSANGYPVLQRSDQDDDSDDGR